MVGRLRLFEVFGTVVRDDLDRMVGVRWREMNEVLDRGAGAGLVPNAR